MPYKRKICKVNAVDNQGDSRKVLLNGGTSLSLSNQNPYGNDITVTGPQPSVQVYSAGQVPQTSQQNTTIVNSAPTVKVSGNQPITTGITKNISVDNQKSLFGKNGFGRCSPEYHLL